MSNINVDNITPLAGTTGTVAISGSLLVSGSVTANGNIILGNEVGDSVTLGAEISSSIIPDANNTYNLGSDSKTWKKVHQSTASIGQVSSSLIPNIDDTYDLGSSTVQWKDLYVDGVAYIDELGENISSSANITALNFIATGSEGNITASGNILITGNVSGSSTSTGSFGHAFNTTMSSSNLTANTLTVNNTSRFHDDVTLVAGGANIINSTGDELVIGSSATGITVGQAAYPLTIDSNVTASLNISGSSTSTITIGGTLTAKGNTALGDTSADTHTFIGNITASGDISASGTVFADNFQSTGEDAGGITFADDVNLTGDITASGNISASGNMSANQLKLNNFLHWGTTTGDNGYIYDDGTNLQLGYNNTDVISVHDTGTRVTITGDLKTTSHITASGNISASGNLSATGDLDIDGKSHFTGNITASGNISASGTLDITGNVNFDGNLDVEGTTKLTGLVTLLDNITSSITSTGSFGHIISPFIVGDLTGDVTGDVTGNADTATEATNITAVATTDNAEFFVGVLDGASGTQAVETVTKLKYNPNSGTLSNTGAISSSGDITGLNLIATGSGVSQGNVTATGTGSFTALTVTPNPDGAALTIDNIGTVSGSRFSTGSFGRLFTGGNTRTNNLTATNKINASTVIASTTVSSSLLFTTGSITTEGSTRIEGGLIRIKGANMTSINPLEVDAAHCGDTSGSKFTVQNLLQAETSGGMTTTQFTVGNTSINNDSVIFGNLVGSLNGTLSASALTVNVTTSTASFSFLTPHSSSLGFGNDALAANNQPFTASFVVL